MEDDKLKPSVITTILIAFIFSIPAAAIPAIYEITPENIHKCPFRFRIQTKPQGDCIRFRIYVQKGKRAVDPTGAGLLVVREDGKVMLSCGLPAVEIEAGILYGFVISPAWLDNSTFTFCNPRGTLEICWRNASAG